MLENSAMLENQTSPFTARGLVNYGIAAAGLAIGTVVADFTDRVVATRKPKDGTNPWYGADAAAAIYRRPDAMRLGVQVVGGVLGLAAAYFAKGRGILPWLATGVALGFGSNALVKVVNWYLMPAVLKVKDPTEKSAANRYYALEQDSVQKMVDDAFAKYATNPALSDGQKGDASVIKSPLGDLTTNLMVLGSPSEGKAEPHATAAGSAVGSGQPPRTFVDTGRIGHCAECGGNNGCYNDCKSLCSNCGDSYTPWMECSYQVEAGDDLAAMAAAGGVTVLQVNAMNNGQTPDIYWVPGNTVNLPYGICMVVKKRQQGVPMSPSMPIQPVAPPTYQPTVIETPPGVTPLSPATTVYGAPPMSAAGPLAGPNGNGNGNGNGQKPEPIVAKKPIVSFWSFNMQEHAQEE